MNYLALVCVFISFSIFADITELPNISAKDCITKCETITYTYQNIGIPFCQEIVSCDVRKFNEESETCELIEEGQRRKYQIACRDVPPAY